MNNKHFFNLAVSLFAIAAFMTGSMANAQTLKINSSKSTMSISGTTNIHNFKSNVSQINGELTFNSKNVKSLKVEVPVRSIVSGEKLMDKKTYETFKEPTNPTITFNLTNVNSMNVSGNDVAVTVTGNLTMGGFTKSVTLKANGQKVKPGVYKFTGSTPLKMSEFKMKAPTAMLGAMKVGDAVTLNYSVTFEGNPID